ncbi:MAG: PaaI family thioesterase [Pseudomonadota bacterium]
MDPLAQIAESQPYSKLLGIKLLEATKDKVVGELLIRDDLCTAGGTMHGGCMMSFCDVLGATGAWLAIPEGAKGTTTIDSNTSFLSGPPAGTLVTGVSLPVRIGRRLSVWQTEVTDPAGKKVCLVTQTQLVL